MKCMISDLEGCQEDNSDLRYTGIRPKEVSKLIPQNYKVESRPRSSKTGSLLLPVLPYSSLATDYNQKGKNTGSYPD